MMSPASIMETRLFSTLLFSKFKFLTRRMFLSLSIFLVGGKTSGSILEPFRQNISRLFRLRSDALNLCLPRELLDGTE